MKSIRTIGIQRALAEFLPYVRQAGRVAKHLHASAVAVSAKNGHDLLGANLVPSASDLICDRLGTDAVTLFDDVSFQGNAGHQLASYASSDRPYLLMCDPTGGMTPPPHRSRDAAVIITLCSRDHEILGVLAYLPMLDLMYSALREATPSGPLVLRERWDHDTHDHRASIGCELNLTFPDMQKTGKLICLGPDLVNDARMRELSRLGYEVAVIDRLDPRPRHATQHPISLFQQKSFCVGAVTRHAPLNSAGALGFMTAQAGGYWHYGRLQQRRLEYEYSAMAADQETLRILLSFV